MEARIELGERAHCARELFGVVLGVRRDERQALESVDSNGFCEQIREIGARGRLSIRIDRLAHEHHFACAARHRGANLAEDVAHRPMIEPAAHVRHDAERAIVRAAALHGGKRAQMAEGILDAVGRSAQRSVENARIERTLVIAEIVAPFHERVAETDEFTRAEDGVNVGDDRLQASLCLVRRGTP